MLLGTSSYAEDSNDTSSNSPNKTQINDIQLLLENALKNENFSDILRRVFPLLSSEEVTKIEENTTKIFEENARQLKAQHDKELGDKSESSHFFHKVSFAITMTLLGTYFGGPIAATCSSTLFTKAYTIIFGVPNSDSLLYGMFFSPCKKFLTSFSNQYGSYVVGTLVAPTSYSAASAIEYISNKIGQFQKLISKRTTNTPKQSLQSAEEMISEFELMNITDSEEVDLLNEDSFTMILPAYDSLKKNSKISEKEQKLVEGNNSSDKPSRHPLTSLF